MPSNAYSHNKAAASDKAAAPDKAAASDKAAACKRIDPSNLEKDVRCLTEKIGIRLAGSDREKEAAAYLRERFLEYCPECRIEEFPVQQSCVEKLDLQLRIGGRWRAFPGYSLNCAPATGGRTLEADVVIFDSHTDYERADLSFVTGKAVILYSMHFPTEEAYRRMMEAKPAFLLMVDTRFTGSIPLGDGLFPAYVEKYGAVPCVDVAYFDAWEWVRDGADRARLTISGCIRSSMSVNVVAEIPGTDPDAGIMLFGGHTDTQAGTVGADDNAIGCAVCLELARCLSGTPHRRTLRFICFGAEEMLSVGSASYVRMHREELERKGVFMCNFDSCGSAMGWNDFCTNMNDGLSRHVRDVFNAHDVWYRECREPEPTNDLFPFTAAGIPGMTVIRRNCEAGNWYHHRADNTADVISFTAAAALAEAALALTGPMADGDLPVGITADGSMDEKVRQCWESTFGGWR